MAEEQKKQASFYGKPKINLPKITIEASISRLERRPHTSHRHKTHVFP